MRLERLATYNVHRSFKQPGDIFLKTHIIEHCDMGLRLDFDNDVEITVRPILAASNRAE